MHPKHTENPEKWPCSEKAARLSESPILEDEVIALAGIGHSSWLGSWRGQNNGRITMSSKLKMGNPAAGLRGDTVAKWRGQRGGKDKKPDEVLTTVDWKL